MSPLCAMLDCHLQQLVRGVIFVRKTLGHYTVIEFGFNARELCFCRRRSGFQLLIFDSCFQRSWSLLPRTKNNNNNNMWIMHIRCLWLAMPHEWFTAWQYCRWLRKGRTGSSNRPWLSRQTVPISIGNHKTFGVRHSVSFFFTYIINHRTRKISRAQCIVSRLQCCHVSLKLLLLFWNCCCCCQKLVISLTLVCPKFVWSMAFNWHPSLFATGTPFMSDAPWFLP